MPSSLLDEAIYRATFSLRHFMRFCWWNTSPFIEGRHTRAICDRITRANEDWRRGKSTYLLVCVPFRHGKSDIMSRALPAWFLGRNADMEPDVIMSAYSASLVNGFSKRAQKIIASERYQMLFPGTKAVGNVGSWGIDGSAGAVTAVGLGGSITGKGGHLIILDDYCKSRAEAVSEVYRNRTWDSFRNDLLSRQAPNAIVIVCATPWHVDDIRGRIFSAMREQPDFPRFEELNFPARKPGEWDYLFPERFSPGWYDAQRATLQRQASALLDCNPMVEGGDRFNPANVRIHEDLEGWPKLREVRGWDMASSAKERNKDDPDWTWGVRGGVRRVHIGSNVYKYELWIRSMVACRAEAPERNRIITATAVSDGPSIAQHVEAFAAYKDAYVELKGILRGHVVRPSHLPGDKSAKLAPLEPVFDRADIHVYGPGCRPYLDMWLSQFAAFPNGKHDDGCDATAIVYHAASSGGSTALV